jgi:hypothetical protein
VDRCSGSCHCRHGDGDRQRDRSQFVQHQRELLTEHLPQAFGCLLVFRGANVHRFERLLGLRRSVVSESLGNLVEEGTVATKPLCSGV